MVTKKNLMEIVKKLMNHMDKAEGTNYRLFYNTNIFINESIFLFTNF